MQNTRISSKHCGVFLLVFFMMCAIGCGAGSGATRSNGGTPPPGPSPTPSPTPSAPGSASLSANPANLGFGSQVINTPVTLTVVVTNVGSAAANITKDSISGSGFSTGITVPITLNPAKSVSIPVIFTPAASGSVAGSLTLSSNGTTLLSVPLTGTGLIPLPHTVDVAWSASTTSTLSGYNVYRSGTSGGPYTKISSTLSPTTLLFTDTTPKSGQKYFYVVTAVDVSGLESTASAEVAVTIPTP